MNALCYQIIMCHHLHFKNVFNFKQGPDCFVKKFYITQENILTTCRLKMYLQCILVLQPFDLTTALYRKTTLFNLHMQIFIFQKQVCKTGTTDWLHPHIIRGMKKKHYRAHPDPVRLKHIFTATYTTNTCGQSKTTKEMKHWFSFFFLNTIFGVKREIF